MKQWQLAQVYIGVKLRLRVTKMLLKLEHEHRLDKIKNSDVRKELNYIRLGEKRQLHRGMFYSSE